MSQEQLVKQLSVKLLVHMPVLHQVTNIGSLHDVFQNHSCAELVDFPIRSCRRLRESPGPTILTKLIELLIEDIWEERRKEKSHVVSWVRERGLVAFTSVGIMR